MSLSPKCDNCGIFLNSYSGDRENIDVLILIDGEISFEFEDLCPKCRQKLIKFIKSGMNIPAEINNNSEKPTSVLKQNSVCTINQPQTKEPPTNLTNTESQREKKTPQNTGLSESVTKRWSLPKIEH